MFRFDPESALLGLIERIYGTSIIQIRERTQSFFVSLLFGIGTFIERLLLYCVDN
jgi:hypothetical protein